MKLDNLLDLLGNRFRGLWVSETVHPNGHIERGWAVTFVFDGQMVETPYQKTAGIAMQYALDILKQKG